MNRFLFLFTLQATLLTWSAYGQHKIPMDHTVYADWKTAGNTLITDDGKFAGYEVKPGQGDGFCCIYNMDEGSTDTIPRASGIKFIPGSEYMAGKILPQAALLREAKKEKSRLSP